MIQCWVNATTVCQWVGNIWPFKCWPSHCPCSLAMLGLVGAADPGPLALLFLTLTGSGSPGCQTEIFPSLTWRPWGLSWDHPAYKADALLPSQRPSPIWQVTSCNTTNNRLLLEISLSPNLSLKPLSATWNGPHLFVSNCLYR